ncbi:hypothetical protein BDZ91DRAFT_737354 [Kalaharituber pfeilii]|nr:hypothetical protein BDZ91DRAFT_737354 [Kalaharituber pfeilii]
MATYRSINRPPSSVFAEPPSPGFPVLDIPGEDKSFIDFAKFFTGYFIEHIDAPYTLHQIQLLPATTRIVNALSKKDNPSTIAALLWCRIDFASHTADEERHGVSNARALACELVAIDCVGYLNEHDVVQYLGYEIPGAAEAIQGTTATESSNLLDNSNNGNTNSANNSGMNTPDGEEGTIEDEACAIASAYGGLNTLEIAIVAEAKYFLSQKSVQRVVDGIVVFWEGLNVTGRKRPHLYNKRKADPYSRLRVPKYQKAFEACFLATFAVLYYAVLIERNPYKITGTETVLLLFFVAFAADEFTQWMDAGTLFYASDIWSWLDLVVIFIGLAFLVWRIIGLVKDDDKIVDTSFDILSLEALVLVPRAFSLLSLDPYFGVLIPCLKQMTKDFCKFMILVGILFLGFLSTFSILGRDKFTMMEMSGLMTRVCGTSAGFDAMKEISPILGPPLMLIFIVLTNILLITSLISLLSNSLTTEYLFMYSTFVMGSVTSNRLTYFYPPLNLIPLFFLRPLRLFLTSTQLRRVRIALLKFTHFPLVAAIVAYEGVARPKSRTHRSTSGPSTFKQPASFAANNRKNLEFTGRLLGKPSPAANSGVVRAASVSHIANTAKQETRQLRETIQELSLKLDALLAKQ